MTSNPLRLTVVYERAENGWTTATIPAVPGTISAGRNRREARETCSTRSARCSPLRLTSQRALPVKTSR